MTADGFDLSMDATALVAKLDALAGPVAKSLARSMAVAGGKILRDEAKLFAPVESGKLRNAIYLAFKTDRSEDGIVTYAVSWNSKKAPHGHLLEFGHWQTHATYKGKDGEWYSNPSAPLATPRWVSARPFLRPALEAAGARAQQAMVERGKERLQELLQGGSLHPPEDEVPKA